MSREHETATTAGARAHARAMAGTVVESMPTMPPGDAADLPPGVGADTVIWDEVVGAGNYTSLVAPRGARIRLVDLEGDACAGVLLHRRDHRGERLNIADTVKVQWQAYPGRGTLLLSDMGRVLAVIETDSSAGHDTFCGTTNRRTNDHRYGDGSVQGPAPNGRDLFALALAKAGRGKRDLAPNINFFKPVRVDEAGTIALLPGAGPGAEVVLRCELDVLVTVVNVPHPLDDRPAYAVTPLRVTAWRSRPAGADDAIRNATPEALRAYLNTEADVGVAS